MNSYDKVTSSINSGKNIFITGAAGTGKSYILNKLKQDFPEMEVTATTGAAAVNVGGVTIHSWAGIGIGDRPAAILTRIMKYDVVERIRSCKLLAIDEISMLDDTMLDLLDETLAQVRGQDAPFGGIQIIVIGDFLQLPPVSRKNENKTFCFDSVAWESAGFTNIVLTHIYRQEDINFLSILKNVRHGNI